MIKIYRLLAPVFLLACLFSCKNGKDVTPVKPVSKIVGTWMWQKQNVTQYVDGVQVLDTVILFSDSSYSSLQFNADGTFKSTGYSHSANSVAVDTVSGKYTYTSTLFTTTTPLTGGVGFAGGVTGTFSSSPPIITPGTGVEQITQLTDVNLTLHTEYSYIYNVNGTPHTYKIVQDAYYNRVILLI